jgi:hypothetical protein
MNFRRFPFVFFVFLTFLVGACSREPFRIQPKADSAPEALNATGSTAAFSIHARALRDENESNDKFDANHLLAGIMLVEIRLENASGAPLILDGLKFQLRDAKGTEWPAITPDQSIKRLIKYYGVRAYAVDGYNTFREKYRGYGFPAKGSLAPGTSAQGYLFFRMPKDTRDFVQPLTLVPRLMDKKGPVFEPIKLD